MNEQFQKHPLLEWFDSEEIKHKDLKIYTFLKKWKFIPYHLIEF